MKLNEWIENKKNELLLSKIYKSVEYDSVNKVEISLNMTSETFNIFAPCEKINTDIEVDNFQRNKIVGKIEGLKVVFNVIKPRCRKPERLYTYVKILNN
jgi:hypothetical protein